VSVLHTYRHIVLCIAERAAAAAAASHHSLVTKTGARETPWRCIMHEPDRGKRATGEKENRVLLDGTRDDDDDVYVAALQKEKQPCV
jgi:hypothetical protein